MQAMCTAHVVNVPEATESLQGQSIRYGNGVTSS